VTFVDRLRPLRDLREQVVSFPPQPVITEDNSVVNIVIGRIALEKTLTSRDHINTQLRGVLERRNRQRATPTKSG